MFAHSGTMFLVLLMLYVGVLAEPKNQQIDLQELARQNKITQQILQHYLQRKLGIETSNSRVPTIGDILPGQTEDDQSGEGQKVADQDEESLQSVETEHINSVYADAECTNCEDDSMGVNRWTMPLAKLGEKRYYLGIFFKANWYKAMQYCRFHGMHLASIGSQDENDKLEKYVSQAGYGNEHFWTGGTDMAEEGSFFWMSTGRPLTFVNWNAGEPNNFRYDNGEEENCLELWNRDGKGLKWNDSPCSFETYFVCEVRND